MAERAADRLLAWFDRQARDLPWRQNTDPYPVWLSEVMLQQTRVETVIPYFYRFLERFPTVEGLAAAEIDEVLALWSGLGYYRRARQLHAAAIQVVERGGFPKTLDGLKALPGIGDYTAAAVGSIAFGLAEPVLDGNVERVLSRVLALEEDPKGGTGRRRLRAAARDFLVSDRAGDSNQALMELGAVVCQVKTPNCRSCPLQAECLAHQRGAVERFPLPRKRKATQKLRLVAAVVEDPSRERTLLFRRPEASTLLAGTWEVPWISANSAEDPSPSAVVAGLGQRYGGEWRLGEHLGEARHAITFRALTVAVHRAAWVEAVERDAPGLETGWFRRGEIKGLATSSLVEKVLRLVWGQDRKG